MIRKKMKSYIITIKSTTKENKKNYLHKFINILIKIKIKNETKKNLI